MMRIGRSISSASFTTLMLCLFSLIGTLKSQAPQAPLPAQSSPTSNDPAAQASTYQLAVKVRRVVLDVVVTDSKGKPVEGLKQDDFKVMEDGAIQPVRFFDAHGTSAADAPQQPIDLHLPVDTFSNLALAPSDRPVTVLVYDLLNTPQPALALAHQALVKFIKDQKSSTRIAIFVLSDRLHMLQGFTDDQTRLMDAVDSKKSKTRNSQLLVADTGEDAASLLAPDPNASAPPGGQAQAPSAADSVLAQLADAEDAEKNFLLQQRLRVTVQAFTDVARFVSALPGRKNLIWMSGAFPMEIWPSRKQSADGTAGGGDFNIATPLDADIRAAQEELKESRVAIYPVDIRGLQVDPQYAASTRTPTMPPKGSRSTPMPPPRSSFGVKVAGENATMDALADTTGGRAFYNTNGLQEAMDAAVLQGSEYYTLTYAPTNSKDDGGERTVKVVLTNPNYQLSYRRRYLAQEAEHPASLQTTAFDENMQHGEPNSTELFFAAKVEPMGAPATASADEIEKIQTYLRTNANGTLTKTVSSPVSVQHYKISFAIVGQELQMPPTQDGKYDTAMRFGLAAYTQDSELLNGMQGTVKSTIPAAQFQKIQSEGYRLSMTLVVPEEAVSLRMAVQDEIGNRIGTMEIPLPVPVPKNTAAATPTK